MSASCFRRVNVVLDDTSSEWDRFGWMASHRHILCKPLVHRRMPTHAEGTSAFGKGIVVFLLRRLESVGQRSSKRGSATAGATSYALGVQICSQLSAPSLDPSDHSPRGPPVCGRRYVELAAHICFLTLLLHSALRERWCKYLETIQSKVKSPR